MWGTRPTGLVEPQGPQERVQRHAVEQLADLAPMGTDPRRNLWRRWWTNWWTCSSSSTTRCPSRLSTCPRSHKDAIPQRTVLFEPQLAEQLVEVPTAVTFVPGRTLVNDRHGHEWVRVVGPTRVYFWKRLFQLHPVGAPRMDTPPAQGGIEILRTATLADVVCGAVGLPPGSHAAQVPAVQGVPVHRQIGGSSCF